MSDRAATGDGKGLGNTLKLIAIVLAIAIPAVGGGFALSVQMGQIGAQVTELTHGQRELLSGQRDQAAIISDHERRVSVIEDRYLRHDRQ